MTATAGRTESTPHSNPSAPSDPESSVESNSELDITGTPPLRWLADILWPAGDVSLMQADSARAELAPPERRWWASPSAQGAEILIPADLNAARTAVRRYHDGFSLKKRARSWAAEAAMKAPPVAERMLSSVLVVADGHTGDRTLDLLDQLGQLMNEPDLRVAVTLARPKSNRKPVIQLLAPNGRSLGWAKVGWTDWTAKLIGTEASWLSRESTDPLVKPELLHDLDICGHRVVVTSGVVGSRRPRRGSSLSPNIELVASIAAMGSGKESRVAQLPWWSSLADVLDAADQWEARLIQAAVDATDHLDFTAGAWHGDLTPWNIMTTTNSGRTVAQVIDWEFAADGVPLGFDICHFHTQVAAELRGNSPEQALDYSARRSPQDLAQLGVDPHARAATWQLYLLELVRRTLALRKAGFPTEEVHQGRAALNRLARIHQVESPPDRH